MAPRNVIVWTLCLSILVLLLTTCVQAQELTEVPASDILEQIENGEDIYYENVRITGELDLSEIELETVFVTRPVWQIRTFGLEKELNIVESKITIKNSIFKNEVDFSDTQLIKSLNFQDSSFLGRANFTDARFTGPANFNNVSFGGDAIFSDVSFTDLASFGDAKFSGNAYFWGASFSGDANFRDASFFDDADFYGANFSGGASFRNAKFDRVDFLNTSFTEVSLYEADFDSMKVNWSSFKKPLVETNPQSFDGPTYVKLIKNFRTLEQFDDADDAYFWYRFRSLTGIVDVFMLLSCGFGVLPYLPLIWGLFIVLLFAGFYKRGNGIRRLKENDEDDSRVSYGDALYFSIVTFTTVGFGDWYPVDRYRKAAVVIEGLLGWLTLALFLVTLANVMIRP